MAHQHIDVRADPRRCPRHPLQGPVWLEDHGAERLYTLDLSPLGVGVHSSRSLGEGAGVRLSFLSRNIAVEGVVRREVELAHLSWRIGIEFLQPEPELLAIALQTQVQAAEGALP